MNIIKDYNQYILETALMHMSEDTLAKASIYTLTVLYIKLFTPSYVERDFPLNVDMISLDYVRDGRKFKPFLKKNIAIVSRSVSGSKDVEYEKKNIYKKIKQENMLYYGLYDSGNPVLLILTPLKSAPLKKDFMYDPKNFYIQPDIRKMEMNDVIIFLYNSGSASIEIIDMYWDIKVAEDPSNIKFAEKEASEEWNKKHAHLGQRSFGFFDD